MYDKVKERYKQGMKRLAVDAGYIKPHICKTLIRDGYKEYKSNPDDCKECGHRMKCTNSKKAQELII